MNNLFETIIYIEFEKNSPEGSSEAISYNLPFIPRVGESVLFNEKTHQKFVNDFALKYLEETKTKIRQYSKVIDIQYQLDDATIFIILGFNDPLK